MNLSSPLVPFRLTASLLLCLSLPACGGGEASAPAAAAPVSTAPAPSDTSAAPVVPVPAPALPVAAPAPAVAEPAPVLTGGIVTDLTIESTSQSNTQPNLPVTFGQVFARGDVAAGNGLSAQLADGSQIPLQVDAKAFHADGSLRHAVLSAVLPSLAASEARKLNLVKTVAPAVQAPAATPAAMLDAGFSTAVSVTADGQTYSVSADQLLKGAGYSSWLAGAIANEWQVTAPFKTAQGIEHPHLSARFAVRWYSGINRARVDVTVENNWAFEAAPRNITYDAQVLVGGKKVYEKAGLTHYHHARWRKTFWWGETPQVHIRHNTKYLIASLAVPNYDQSVKISEATLAAIGAQWSGARTEPMNLGMAFHSMPDTGARPDIGLLPAWSAVYLLSMDKRAKDAMLGTADLAGTWSSHYRDKKTDRPVSLVDYPYMTTLGNRGDTYNPATGKLEAFPECATTTACKTPNQHDTPHQPGFAYLPYLITGDQYYLEELQFWAMFDVFTSHPGYRFNVKGLLVPDQIRGQAWTLRTLSEAAYATPARDPLKAHFEGFLSNNLDWYNENYSNNAAANSLGFITNGNAYAYSDGTGVAPWQDDFFTAAVGHAVDLGFTKAAPLLAWKARFPVARMNEPGGCWIRAAMYSMVVRPSPTSPVYSTLGQAYAASTPPELTGLACNSTAMAAALQLKVGEMTGYSSSATGYPSNMQPALAYSAGVAGQGGRDAWSLFMSRSVKPNYEAEPQFAIIPR